MQEFVGLRLVLEPEEHSHLGRTNSRLGVDAMMGSSIYSVQDKFRVRIFAETLDEYRRFLPKGDRCEPLADAVFLYVGDQLDWDVELALPAGAVEPLRLGRFGELGYTSWMAPNWSATDETVRRDARFHPAERQRRKRELSQRASAHGG